MSNDTRNDRGRWWPAAQGLILTGIVLLVAACSGGAATAGAGAAGPTYQQALVAYAQCMRAHGEPDFPDPTSQGAFPHIPPPSSPRYQTANRACQHLIPSRPLTAAQKRQNTKQALQFSACMRAHGAPNFPDPVISGGGAAVGLHVAHLDRNSPQFQAAVQACRTFEPGMAGGLMSGGGAP
jgi:hypothetical protein